MTRAFEGNGGKRLGFSGPSCKILSQEGRPCSRGSIFNPITASDREGKCNKLQTQPTALCSLLLQTDGHK